MAKKRKQNNQRGYATTSIPKAVSTVVEAVEETVTAVAEQETKATVETKVTVETAEYSTTLRKLVKKAIDFAKDRTITKSDLIIRLDEKQESLLHSLISLDGPPFSSTGDESVLLAFHQLLKLGFTQDLAQEMILGAKGGDFESVCDYINTHLEIHQLPVGFTDKFSYLPDDKPEYVPSTVVEPMSVEETVETAEEAEEAFDPKQWILSRNLSDSEHESEPESNLQDLKSLVLQQLQTETDKKKKTRLGKRLSKIQKAIQSNQTTISESEESQESEMDDILKEAENMALDLLEDMDDFFELPTQPAELTKINVLNLSSAGWTGSNPKELLEHYARKFSVQPVYFSLQRPTGFAFGVRFKNTKKWQHPLSFETADDIAISTKLEAQHYVATFALFKITHVQNRLPPDYRALWDQWEAKEKQLETERDNEKLAFVTQLLKQCQTSQEQPLQRISNQVEEKTRRVHPLPSLIDLEHWTRISESEKYLKMLSSRQLLPVYQQKQALLDLMKNRVLLVCGETGSGKSTQLPQFILEQCILNQEQCSILVTQPRRISAISLSERVGQEIHKQWVGYQVRNDHNLTKDTRITYCTTGILLKRLESDPHLESLTHVIMDEIHERTLESDLLLMLLKRIMTTNTCLKLVLMSATAEADKFSEYLQCPVIHVPGKTFPVQTLYLEDAYLKTPNIDQDDEYELIYQLVRHIDTLPKGAVLIFMPGKQEIQKMCQLLESALYEKNPPNWKILPLHSQLTNKEQSRVFQTTEKRKIVVSTNVAETGITIPDIVYVIDTCRARDMQWDEKSKIKKLVDIYISKANARQRRGRAGRVQEGMCWHLVTKERFNKLKEFKTPDIRRLPLHEIILQTKSIADGPIDALLQELIDPPQQKSINYAKNVLLNAGALDESEQLTSLGRFLSSMPVDVKIGSMLFYGTFLQCIDPILVMSSALSLGISFESAQIKAEGDLSTIYKVYQLYQQSDQKQAFLKRHQIQQITMQQLMDQINLLRSNLKEHFNTLPSVDDKNRIQMVLVNAFYPNILIDNRLVNRQLHVRLSKKSVATLKGFNCFYDIQSQQSIEKTIITPSVTFLEPVSLIGLLLLRPFKIRPLERAVEMDQLFDVFPRTATCLKSLNHKIQEHLDAFLGQKKPLDAGILDILDQL